MTELEYIFRVLKPGGWVVIHTMNIESLFARLMGRKWPWFMEMQLYYFSERTLRRILGATKFQRKLSQTQGRYLRLVIWSRGLNLTSARLRCRSIK